MTAKYLVDGVTQTDTPTLVKGKSDGLDSAADGSAGTGSVIVRDPTGILSFKPWAEWAIEDDAADVPRSWTGHAVNVTVSRGDYTVDPGRIHTIDLFDLNGLLRRQALDFTSANIRPAETGSQRMAWLLASRALSGVVYDNGRVAANPWNFEGSDYRGKYADDVLTEISVSSVDDDLGMLSYVYWDPAAAAGQRYSLAYYAAAANPALSTIKLSNVAAEVNNTDTFWIHPDPQLTQAGEDIYCGVFFTTKNGTIYRHSATTHAAFFATSGIHRDGQFSTDRIGLGDTANRHAAAWLANHAGIVDTLKLTVRLSVAAVNSLQAGMRASVHIPHLPGFATAVELPVRRRSVPIVEGRRVWYDIPLEMSLKGIAALGGGSPGSFPNPTVSGNPIVQQVSGLGQLTMPNAISAGNTLVYVAGTRGQNVYATTDGSYTNGPDGTTRQTGFFGGAGLGDGAGLVYKVVVSASESTSLDGALNGNYIGTWYELRGAWAPDATAHAGAIATGVSPLVGPITAPAGIVFGVGALGEGGAFDGIASSPWYTPGAGWTEDCDLHSDGGHPVVETAHMVLTAGASVTFNPTGAGTGGAQKWAAQVVAFTSTSWVNPPTPGQWVYFETPTPTPNGTATTFTLANTFADGSLIVYVDRLDQTAAVTSYNGVAKTFTLGFAPKAGEKIEVSYQGR